LDVFSIYSAINHGKRYSVITKHLVPIIYLRFSRREPIKIKSTAYRVGKFENLMKAQEKENSMHK